MDRVVRLVDAQSTVELLETMQSERACRSCFKHAPREIEDRAKVIQYSKTNLFVLVCVEHVDDNVQISLQKCDFKLTASLSGHSG